MERNSHYQNVFLRQVYGLLIVLNMLRVAAGLVGLLSNYENI